MSQYCYIEKNAIIKGPCVLPKNWQNVSGLNLLTDSELKIKGWLKVIDEGAPTYNVTTQKLIISYDINVDTVIKIYTIVDKIQDEIESDLQSAKISKFAEIAQQRYEIETGGIIYEDYVILSDRSSISRLKETVDEITSGTIQSVNWKCTNDQWLTLNAENVEEIKREVITHITNCFDAERLAQDEINAMTEISEVDNYMFNLV